MTYLKDRQSVFINKCRTHSEMLAETLLLAQKEALDFKLCILIYLHLGVQSK